MGVTVIKKDGGGGSGSTAWGSISGTLADQTDLQSALDGKAPLPLSDGASFTTISTSTPTTFADITLLAGKKYRLDVSACFLLDNNASPSGAILVNESSGWVTLSQQSWNAITSTSYTGSTLFGSPRNANYPMLLNMSSAMTNYGVAVGSCIADNTGSASNRTVEIQGFTTAGDLTIQRCLFTATEIS